MAKAKSYPSDWVRSVLNKFPLVGIMQGPRRPRDAQWLLAVDWQSDTYPRGSRNSDNIDAILEWLDCEIEILGLDREKSRAYLKKYPDLKEFCGLDQTPIIADAHSLAGYLHDVNRWKAPPPEPSRNYTRLPEDLEAAVEELRWIREWIIGWLQGQPGGRKRKRGKYKTGNDPRADAELVHGWEAAKREGVRTIAAFCEAHRLDQADFRAAQERHRHRQRKHKRR